MHKRFNLAIYLALLVMFFDQITKWWMIQNVPRPHGALHVGEYLNFVLVENRGMTFGLLSQLNPTITFYFLTITAGLILFLLGRWLWRTSSSLIAFSLGLIIGGAIGNIIDRMRYGVVVDFIDFHLGDHHWYAFNLADSAIVTGVGILLLDGVLRKR